MNKIPQTVPLQNLIQTKFLNQLMWQNIQKNQLIK